MTKLKDDTMETTITQIIIMILIWITQIIAQIKNPEMSGVIWCICVVCHILNGIYAVLRLRLIKEIIKMKRIDECFKCSKRRCRTRIVTPDMKYDEVACDEHIRDLELHTDKVLGHHNGVMRHHISSTAQVKRGQFLKSYADTCFKRQGDEK